MGLMMCKIRANFDYFLHLHCLNLCSLAAEQNRWLPWPPCWFLYLRTLITQHGQLYYLERKLWQYLSFLHCSDCHFLSMRKGNVVYVCVLGWFVYWRHYAKKIVCGRTTLMTIKSEIVFCGTQNWAQKLSLVTLCKLKLSVTWKWLLLYSKK